MHSAVSTWIAQLETPIVPEAPTSAPAEPLAAGATDATDATDAIGAGDVDAAQDAVGKSERSRRERDKRRERERAKKVAKSTPEAAKQGAWTTWPEEEKLKALVGCKEFCAKPLLNVKKKGGPVERNLLDDCVGKCTR